MVGFDTFRRVNCGKFWLNRSCVGFTAWESIGCDIMSGVRRCLPRVLNWVRISGNGASTDSLQFRRMAELGTETFCCMFMGHVPCASSWGLEFNDVMMSGKGSKRV